MTKQARMTARRKARQARAYRAFLGTKAPVLSRMRNPFTGEYPAFGILSQRVKCFIVTYFSDPQMIKRVSRGHYAGYLGAVALT